MVANRLCHAAGQILAGGVDAPGDHHR